MEANRFIRPHERTAVSDTADRARRLGPHMTAYSQRLGQMSLSDGVPIVREAPPEEPEAGDFLDEEPPFGDPL